MTDTAKRLAGPALLTNASATLYTVPGATTAIVRQISIANTSGSAATARMSIGADAAGTRILPDVNVPANSVMDWPMFLVLATTETIKGESGTTNVLAYTISGVEVS